jgi:hypothetical protein
MSSVSQVVGHELREQRPQVAIGQDDHVVEQLAATVATKRSATPFCHGQRKLYDALHSAGMSGLDAL